MINFNPNDTLAEKVQKNMVAGMLLTAIQSDDDEVIRLAHRVIRKAYKDLTDEAELGPLSQGRAAYFRSLLPRISPYEIALRGGENHKAYADELETYINKVVRTPVVPFVEKRKR